MRLIVMAAMVINMVFMSPPFAAESLHFDEVSIPDSDAGKRRVNTTPTIWLAGRPYPMTYTTLLRSGDGALNGIGFGTLIDHNGRPLTRVDGSVRISPKPDFSSLLPSPSGELFMLSHIEDVPGAIYLTALSQDLKTGKLTAQRTRPLDLSPIGGGWNHCAGSITPWHTHLGSEEYEPDAKRLGSDGRMPTGHRYNAMAAYYPETGLQSVNPYQFGWPLEIAVDSFEQARINKHYAMGRFSVELAYVLPDQRSAYLSDDGHGTGLYLFVADQPKNLSAGYLYAAEWQQQDDKNGGRAQLRWHNLGHASDAEIAAHLKAGIRFRDLFDSAEPDGDSCPPGFVSINQGHGGRAFYPGHECLRLRPGMEQAASRLETRRYAAIQGATTEFSKMEGISFDPESKRLFLAISAVSKGMQDSGSQHQADARFDIGGPNHIRLDYNPCGAVYTLGLQPKQNDTDGMAIDSPYVAQTMAALIQGQPAIDGLLHPANRCALDAIANPDNLSFIPGHDILLIGEDSDSGHQTNMLWAYQTRSAKLTRILTAPYGAEISSVYFYPNIHGFAYITAVIQHPFGGETKNLYRPGSFSDRSYIGYLGPLPALDK